VSIFSDNYGLVALSLSAGVEKAEFVNFYMNTLAKASEEQFSMGVTKLETYALKARSKLDPQPRP